MAVGKEYCVYIMTNAHHAVLYTGVTNNLARRVYEHKNGLAALSSKNTMPTNWSIMKLATIFILQLREKSKSKAAHAKRKLIW